MEVTIVPALLYFFGVWCSLTVEANRLGLVGLPKESLPRFSDVLLKTGYKAIPLLIVITLLVMGRNPLFAASVSIGACIILSFVKREDRMTIGKFIQTLEAGAKTAITVAIACIIVGVVIGIMGATGVTLRIGDIILSYTAGNLPLTLFVTMCICILLGMGMPTTPSYVMTGAVALPVLAKMGCVVLDTHLFVFFFAVLSSVTPPVCVGAYTAAGLAGSAPTKTGFTALRLALPRFIIPYIFIISPVILLTHVTSCPYFALCLSSALVGIIFLAIGMEGFLKIKLRPYERLFFLGAALCLITPGIASDVAGLSLALAGYILLSMRARGSTSRGSTSTRAV